MLYVRTGIYIIRSRVTIRRRVENGRDGSENQTPKLLQGLQRKESGTNEVQLSRIREKEAVWNRMRYATSRKPNFSGPTYAPRDDSGGSERRTEPL